MDFVIEKVGEDDIVYCKRQVVDVEFVVGVVVEVEAYEDCAMTVSEMVDEKNEMLLVVHVRIDVEREAGYSFEVNELGRG